MRLPIGTQPSSRSRLTPAVNYWDSISSLVEVYKRIISLSQEPYVHVDYSTGELIFFALDLKSHSPTSPPKYATKAEPSTMIGSHQLTPRIYPALTRPKTNPKMMLCRRCLLSATILAANPPIKMAEIPLITAATALYCGLIPGTNDQRSASKRPNMISAVSMARMIDVTDLAVRRSVFISMPRSR